jgi:gluconokinase
MVIVLMGVAGSGKTTTGMLLARRLGWPFHDGDDLHPAANRAKMHRGLPLTDEDRRPWLEAVRDLIQHCVNDGENAIVACSALKRSYRDEIIVDPAVVKLVYLKGSSSLINERLAGRHGHFFNPELLQSQFAALEEPTDATIEDISRPAPVIVDSILAQLGL